MPTPAEVMVAFVLGFPTEAFCVQCLARKTGVAHHEIRAALRDLTVAGRIRRGRGRCSRCHRVLMVLSAPGSAASDTIETDCAAG